MTGFISMEEFPYRNGISFLLFNARQNKLIFGFPYLLISYLAMAPNHWEEELDCKESFPLAFLLLFYRLKLKGEDR
jgi:hypothetical protein